ncbi:MAG TPA: alpha-galactosidase [Candidatus Binatia bacterium]|nr:alpha-galactosidase [Candidatus Binatia bacterium]
MRLVRNWIPTLLATVILLPAIACSKQQQPQAPQPAPAQVSKIVVEASGGQLLIRTANARFEVSPEGSIHATLLKDGKEFSLEQGQGDASSDYVIKDGKEISPTLDLGQIRIEDAPGKLGIGKRITIPAKANSDNTLQQTLAIEVYDGFPNFLLTSASLTNKGNSDLKIDQIVEQNHLFSSGGSQAYDMWSFQGSSYDWGEDDVRKLTRKFSQPNVMGASVKGGYGGGIPVVAFWNSKVGEAIGHVETIPLSLSLPVAVKPDGQVSASVSLPGTTLKPGETYSTPRSFISVYAGDFYEPLRMWSSVLQKEGWQLPKPSNEAYNVSWCGWGYEFNVTPAQMLGTVPKLKEFGIKWATLDDRWFDTYGDWNPRHETFPDDSIKKMVDDFHKQNELVQLWWLPLGAEDGQGRWESHKYIVSKVAKDHPDWFILDKNGKHARMTRDLAALCPAVPEVQAYYKQLTEKFIRDWGFDGSKLDNIYSVPMCFNPAHHHKSPQDSVNAMADVYKTIFETTRAIKPESVTQSCPCGTPPSLAWLPYIDQAVTADPVGAVQVRRRTKMYKALLGPEAAVYGDHVELSAMTRVGKDWKEHGDDFASTIGTGGIVGTKFVWPDPGPKFQAVALTPQKEEHWKKWIGIYNEKMLSKGDFLDLYIYGYDIPEAYAIEKDGKMYYAFFAPENSSWKGEVELRGLQTGTYRILDYANNKDMGTVQAAGDKPPRLSAEFKDHLLIEVSKQ